jgi:uncharacterized membrane protein (TIGR02234 family)
MRLRAVAFGCLLIGGALALVGSAQPWWRATGDGAALKFTGTQATAGLSQALAIVALAGTLLLLALRTRGRRVVGAILVLVGTGLALVGGLRLRPSPDAVRIQAHQASLADTFRLNTTTWPWIFAFAGVLIAVGGAVTMITAASWSSRSDRFQPRLNRTGPTTSEDSTELWKAMDAGLDPTADDHDTPTRDDPEVRDRSLGDTMGGTGQTQQLPWSPTSPLADPVERSRREREA